MLFIYSALGHAQKLVLIAVRVHPFPSRTRKLSSLAPKILGGQLPGKIGRCQLIFALIAQSVEHAAVNRGVTGSSPVRGAKKERSNRFVLFLSIAKAMAYHHDAVVYIIAARVRRISSRVSVYQKAFAMMIYKTKVLMICNSCGIDDIQCFALIYYRFYAILNPRRWLHAKRNFDKRKHYK